MNTLIYRQWYFARQALARRYLDQLLEGTGDPLALFAPRRVGKTWFLSNELKAEAIRRGMLPVYIDLYLNRDDALDAINYTLERAIDDLTVPATTAGRRLKTAVKKVEIAGAAIELGDEPARRRPRDTTVMVDWLLRSLVRAAGRPILLMIDEVQELALAKKGDTIISALRSAITQSFDAVRVVFTGSSQERLLELFSRSRAPLYEGASLVPFPTLGDDFIAFVEARMKALFRKSADHAELAAAFKHLNYQPRPLIDLVLAFGSSDYPKFSALVNARRGVLVDRADFEENWYALTPVQRRICRRIALGEDVSSQAARVEYAGGDKRQPLGPGSVQSALRQLLRDHIITRASAGRGAYLMDDSLFAEWIRRWQADPDVRKPPTR